MRKLIVSIVLLAGSVGVGALPAGAAAPMVQPLPDAACNSGTATARAATAGSDAGMHVPMNMMGMCMTMPGTHP
jgi:hypothetical protein